MYSLQTISRNHANMAKTSDVENSLLHILRYESFTIAKHEIYCANMVCLVSSTNEVIRVA